MATFLKYFYIDTYIEIVRVRYNNYLKLNFLRIDNPTLNTFKYKVA